ncbi:hypothetical protein FRB90_003192 [Tulasnella sp. 427]|nr:hypothetical protein FRB90_003192 [Tulasnella sp. 427]
MRVVAEPKKKRAPVRRPAQLTLPADKQNQVVEAARPDVPEPGTDLGTTKRKRVEKSLRELSQEHTAVKKKRRKDLLPSPTAKDAPLWSKTTLLKEAANTTGRKFIDSDSASGRRSTALAPKGEASLPLGPGRLLGSYNRDCPRSASGENPKEAIVSSNGLDLSRVPSSIVEAGASSTPENSVATDPPAPWIDFGHLSSLENPNIRHHLKLQNDARRTRRLWVGSDKENCEIWVTGPDVEKYHCALELELYYNPQGQLRREVTVKRITTCISPPNVLITIWAGQEDGITKDGIILQDGAVIQFGNGELFEYTAPKLASLYTSGDQLRDQTNSCVTRVLRKCDRRPFVVKAIPATQRRMAQTEVAAFKHLGSHARLVSFLEAFYSAESKIHQLIFEPGHTDLLDFTLKYGEKHCDWFVANAESWTRQITEGIDYMHQHNVTHRDLKPENILVVISNSGHVGLKIIDLGLARLPTEPIPTKLWHLGTRNWKSPAAFRVYPDDRLADCYGIGRILHFILMRSKWIPESHDPRKICGCPTPCKKMCTARHAALEAVVTVGGRSCVDFLKHLLVPFPDMCMNTSRMLEHAYLAATSER